MAMTTKMRRTRTQPRLRRLVSAWSWLSADVHGLNGCQGCRASWAVRMSGQAERLLCFCLWNASKKSEMTASARVQMSCQLCQLIEFQAPTYPREEVEIALVLESVETSAADSEHTERRGHTGLLISKQSQNVSFELFNKKRIAESDFITLNFCFSPVGKQRSGTSDRDPMPRSMYRKYIFLPRIFVSAILWRTVVENGWLGRILYLVNMSSTPLRSTRSAIDSRVTLITSTPPVKEEPSSPSTNLSTPYTSLRRSTRSIVTPKSASSDPAAPVQIPISPSARKKPKLEPPATPVSTSSPARPPRPKSSSKKPMPILTLEKPHPFPAKWKEQYRLIERMRKGIIAPVDDM